jgi:hypothetical protein
MKFLLIVLFIAIAKITLAQNTSSPPVTSEPTYKIILKGINLYGIVPVDSFISALNKSYNDTLCVWSTAYHTQFKVLSFDITIAHRMQNLISFHSSDGVLKEPFYSELKSCHARDIIYFDKVYYIKNGIPIPVANTSFKLK